jgi:hypothetical protein
MQQHFCSKDQINSFIYYLLLQSSIRILKRCHLVTKIDKGILARIYLILIQFLNTF